MGSVAQWAEEDARGGDSARLSRIWAPRGVLMSTSSVAAGVCDRDLDGPGGEERLGDIWHTQNRRRDAGLVPWQLCKDVGLPLAVVPGCGCWEGSLDAVWLLTVQLAGQTHGLVRGCQEIGRNMWVSKTITNDKAIGLANWTGRV